MSDNPFATPEDLSAQSAAPANGEVAPADGTFAAPAAEAPDPLEAFVGAPAGTSASAVADVPSGGQFADPAVAEKAPKSRISGGAVALIAVGALLLGAVGGFGAAFAYDSANNDTKTVSEMAALPAADQKTLSQDLGDGSVASISAAVMPSVVSIEAASNDGRQSTGSGFVVRDDGYIVTNNHVIDGADGSIKVLFSDGSVVDAEVVGHTSDYDLAVLKVDKKDLTPLVLGDSDQMVVGDSVIAIGSPLGLDSTVTTGIISALHRPVTAGESQDSTSFIDAIQTDAAINPGNSGGPLINAAGQVIGINSAIASLSDGSSQAGSVGLGFAIPSNQVRRTVDELIATGTATYPVIGVMLDSTNQGEGVLIATKVDGKSGVVAGGPADAAGVEPGDVITAIDGRTITRGDDLVVAIRAKAPGDKVTLTIKRDGKEQDIDVVLAANKDVTFGSGGSGATETPAP